MLDVKRSIFITSITMKKYDIPFTVRRISMSDQQTWTGHWCLLWAIWQAYTHQKETKFGIQVSYGNLFQCIQNQNRKIIFCQPMPNVQGLIISSMRWWNQKKWEVILGFIFNEWPRSSIDFMNTHYIFLFSICNSNQQKV